MDLSMIVQFCGVLVILAVIIFLIYATLKYGGKYMGKLSNGNIIKIIERVPLSQNTFLSVVLIEDKPFVISNGEKGVQVLMELNKETIENYKKNEVNKNFIQINEILANKLKGKMKNEKI